jgi:hypothetical protein
LSSLQTAEPTARFFYAEVQKIDHASIICPNSEDNIAYASICENIVFCINPVSDEYS